jgi:hypothetical protein
MIIKAIKKKVKNISIPVRMFGVIYDSSMYPKNSRPNVLKKKANCQLFVYAVLGHFGYKIPGFRSSELWSDNVYTKKVEKPKMLDILLFNKTKSAYGAHLGLCLGNDRVIHLSKKIGYPTIWSFAEFEKHSQYKVLVGIKRLRN